MVGAVDGIAHVQIVFGNQHGIVRQEGQQRHLLGAGPCQLRHNLDAVATVARQLCLHLEGSDTVDVVAKEVDAEGILATVGVDIENGAAKGKLAWLVDIVNLVETKVGQRRLNVCHTDGLIRRQCQCALAEHTLVDHHLGNGLRVSDNVEMRSER